MQITVGDYAYVISMWSGGPVLETPKKGGILAIDTETEVIKHGTPLVPVLLQVCCHNTKHIHLVLASDMDTYMLALAKKNPSALYVFHNAPFDLKVLGLNEPGKEYLLQALNERRVLDTGIRFLMYKLAMGRADLTWGLDAAAKEMLGVEVEKDEEIRLTFTRDMEITERHAVYAAIDSAITAQLALALPPCPTEYVQLLGFIALSDISWRGFLVDISYMQDLRKAFEDRANKMTEALSAFGYYPGQPGNKSVMQRLMQHIEGELQFLEDKPDLRFSRTEKKGEIQTSKESLQIMGSRNHPFVSSFQEQAHCKKMMSTYMNTELVHVDQRVHPRFTPLVKTGRTSCRGPNIQNVPRKENIRGIYLASPGYVLFACDYAQLELCALAQSCLTWQKKSVMADVINTGADLHRWFAARILDKEQEAVTGEERQMAKACYSSDTEFLTPAGWVSCVALYETQVDHVAQYDPDTKTIDFVEPADWIRKDNQDLIEFKHDQMDLCVTPDHRMLEITQAGCVLETTAELFNGNESNSSVHAGNAAYVPALYHNDGLTRLAIATQADGSFHGTSVRFDFSKERKILRLRVLLDEGGFVYNETHSKDVVTFSVRDLRSVLTNKELLTEDKEFTNWKKYDPVLFIDELYKWDGHEHSVCSTHKQYHNTSKRSVDIAQTVLVLNGYQATKRTTHVPGKLPMHMVSWYTGTRKRRDICRLSGLRKGPVSGKHTVYCCSVPTSWLLVRRNGKVTVCGNCNFGFPGGLGIRTFQGIAKNGYGLDLSEEQCQDLKQQWIGAFPEMEVHLKPQLDEVATRKEKKDGQQWYLARTITGRVRRKATYCSACNYPFQGLSADGARIALWYLYLEKYPMVNFIHDEVIFELPEDEYLQQRIARIQYLMVAGMRQVIPDVLIRVEGSLMRRWHKDAESLTDEQGNLLVWEPT